MINKEKLRALALKAVPIEIDFPGFFGLPPSDEMMASVTFIAYANPKTVLSLLDEIVVLKNELSLARGTIESRDRNIDDLVAHNAELKRAAMAHLDALEIVKSCMPLLTHSQSGRAIQGAGVALRAAICAEK